MNDWKQVRGEAVAILTIGTDLSPVIMAKIGFIYQIIKIKENNMQQKKLELYFSTTDIYGEKAEERHVRHLIAGMAEVFDIDGYTLTKAVTGYWQGKEEDSFTLTVVCFSNYQYNKAVAYLKTLSEAIKRFYDQTDTLLIETNIMVVSEEM